MIRFACPYCHDIYQTEPERAGQLVDCRRCAKKIKVPSVPTARVVEEPHAAERKYRSGFTFKVIAGAIIAITFGLFAVVLALVMFMPRSVDESVGPANLADDSKAASLAADFDALDKWCERSIEEIHAACKVNQIRGDELRDRHLEWLRQQMLDKPVRWKLKAIYIGNEGVRIDGRGKVHQQAVPRVYTVLDITGNKEFGTGKLLADPPGFGWQGLVTDVLRQRLHDLSVGDIVTIEAIITGVYYNVTWYRFRTAYPRIDQPIIGIGWTIASLIYMGIVVLLLRPEQR